MATVKRRRPRSEGTAPTTQSHASDSPAKVSACAGSNQNGQARLGERVEFECPLCGKDKANATYKLDRDGHPRWFVSCWSGSCDSGAEYLDLLAEAWELPEGSTPEDLAAAACRRAEAGLGGSRRRDRRAEPEPLPSLTTVDGWAARLLTSPEPLRYLTGTRGLSLDVIRAARIGWDGQRLVFPMFRGGELVAAKWRLPKAGGQMRSWAGNGRPWPLYPEPDPAWRRLLLVAGEFDALRALSVGLRAASVTLGAGHWRDDWTDALRGRHVVVCFDNNEVEQACERVAALTAAGVTARRLDLRRLGLRTPKGDLSDYLNGGGSAEALRRAVRPRIVRRAG
jgi:hypothetical protein